MTPLRPCDLCESDTDLRDSTIIRRLDGRYQGVVRCRDHDLCRQRTEAAGYEWPVDERRAGQLVVDEDALVEAVNRKLGLVH